MAVTSPEQFLKLLKKSKLLDEEQLAEAREAAQEAKDAKALAKALARKKVLTLWQAGQLLAGRAAFKLGKYKLIDFLGSGGMGRVFRAEHTTMSRPVALKIISKKLARDPVTLKQFLAEARAIASLDHPNMVHPYDVDREGDIYYLVMEYVEGRDLQRMVESKGPLPFARAARYIQQAADGLAHAHGRKMIHCDIKPANLLVNKQDVVKILDMGMARLIDRTEKAASEKDDRSLGTVDYLAPEQAMESPELDHRADVYSLGCTFYFLLTGKPPFPEGTLHERILKHQTQQPQKIAELRPDTPQPLAEICEKMMAKEPGARYQSADEVSQALGQWVASHEEEAEAVLIAAEPSEGGGVVLVGAEGSAAGHGSSKRPGPLARVGSALTGPRRMLWLGGLGGAAALILVGGLAFYFFFSGPGGEPEEPPDEQVAAVETKEETSEPVEEVSSEREQPGEDSEFPDLPDLGNLRDFDPEAIFDKGSDASGEPEGEAPDMPAAKKAEPAQPATEEGAEPTPPPAEKKPDSKPPTQTSPPEKPDPEKKEPEKPEPKPEPKPKPKPPPADPLKGLAESFNLPEVALTGGSDSAAGEAVTIGKIAAGPETEWQLYLLGGDNAVRGSRAFVLQQQEPDPAKAKWQVQLETPKGSGEPTREDVAGLWREGDALRFQWADTASSTANYLRNCILQVRVAGKSKYVTLTQPTTVEPIPIDLERGMTNAGAPVKWLPDAGNLRIQITQVEGREGQVTEPPEPADAKTPMLLTFPRKDRHGNTADRVAFRLSFTPRPTALQIKLQLTEPHRDSFRALQANAEITRNQLENLLTEVDKQLHPKNKEPPRGETRSRLGAQVDELQMQMWYVDFYLQVQAKAQIHYRVFTEVDGREVVLASTQPVQ